MIKLTNEKAKKIIGYLDGWILETDSKKLDSNKKSNYTVTFDEVNNQYEDVFLLTQREINSEYDLLGKLDKDTFLIAVYKKTALELWSIKNFKSGDNEAEESSSLDKQGRKLFAEYCRIVDILRNQGEIYAF
nr:hypothetical protein [Methanobrevibacter arboriphilus]